MSERSIEPHIFVIVGVTGNLTGIKLFPSIYQLHAMGILSKNVTLSSVIWFLWLFLNYLKTLYAV